MLPAEKSLHTEKSIILALYFFMFPIRTLFCLVKSIKSKIKHNDTEATQVIACGKGIIIIESFFGLIHLFFLSLYGSHILKIIGEMIQSSQRCHGQIKLN